MDYEGYDILNVCSTMKLARKELKRAIEKADYDEYDIKIYNVLKEVAVV
jgi:hypothetical protein